MRRLLPLLWLIGCRADPVPPCVDGVTLPVIVSGGILRVDSPSLGRAVGTGAVTHAVLRAELAEPAVVSARRLTQWEADPADPPSAWGGPGRRVGLDVTADVGAWLDGTAPAYGWALDGSVRQASLELCVDAGPEPDLVQVGSDGWGFVGSASGEPFVPLGVNYDHDDHRPCGRLLEAYWDAEWASVEQDLGEIAALGFDAVRIHLQYREFMNAVDQPNESALVQLDQLVRAARRHGLRLDLTGLALYERDRIPAWFAALDDEAQTQAEEAFWRAVARRYPGEPAIFAYDLQNEPFVMPGDTDEVVSGPFATCDPDGPGPEPARGFSYVQYHFRHAGPRWTAWVHDRYGDEAALDAAWPDWPTGAESWDAIARPGFFSSSERARDELAFRHDMAALWTTRMAQAVREVDPDHLITVGLTSGSLPFQDRRGVEAGEWLIYSSFSPLYVGPAVDFVSVHVYPTAHGDQTDEDLSEMTLRGSYVGEPVVLEETFPLVDEATRDRFLARSVGSVSGWFGFYWGRTPDELRAEGDVTDAIVADWVDRYAAFAADEVPEGGAPRTSPVQTAPAPITALMADPQARAALTDQYAATAATGGFLDPILEP